MNHIYLQIYRYMIRIHTFLYISLSKETNNLKSVTQLNTYFYVYSFVAFKFF